MTTTNPAPELPVALNWKVLGRYYDRPELGLQTFFYYGDEGKVSADAHEAAGDVVRPLFTLEQLQSFRADGVAEERRRVAGLVEKWRAPTPQDECTLYTMGQRSGRNACADELAAMEK